MIEEKALPVCPDCHCVMYKRNIKTTHTILEGWSCIECSHTIWRDDE